MAGPSSPSFALAGRLLEHEAASGTAEALAEAAERVCQRLYHRLAPLIGPDGFRVLLANAVDLTRSNHSFLQVIDSRAGLDGCFSRLADAVHGQPADQALDGLTELLGRFIELLASFVGEALTLRLVRRAWPEIAWEDAVAGERETGK